MPKGARTQSLSFLFSSSMVGVMLAATTFALLSCALVVSHGERMHAESGTAQPGCRSQPAVAPGRQGFDAFKASLCDAAGASRVALVLSCVDNYEARMTINQARPAAGGSVHASLRLQRTKLPDV